MGNAIATNCMGGSGDTLPSKKIKKITANRNSSQNSVDRSSILSQTIDEEDFREYS